MSKKQYDFSAFDEPAQAKSEYDFSAFDAPKQSDGGILEALKDAALSATQGATFGFADEALGGLSAAGEVLTGKTSLENIVDAYKRNRDEYRHVYEQAENRSPVASTIGGIAGGLGPALLMGPLGAVAEGATLASRIGQAAKIGAGAGAISGAGTSTADLTEGKVLDAAKDVAYGAGSGAALGGLLQGGIETAKGIGSLSKDAIESIKKTKPVNNFDRSLEKGKKGINLVSEDGMALREEDLTKASEQLGMGIRDTYKKLGPALGRAKKALSDSGVEVPVGDELSLIQKFIKEFKESPDKLKRDDAKFLQGYLDDLLKGTEKELQVPTISSSKVVEVPATGSAREKLEQEAARLTENSKRKGENATFRIVESEDKKFISLEKIVDEQVAAPERAIPIRDQDGNIVSYSLEPNEFADTFKSGLNVKTIENTPGSPAFTKEMPPVEGIQNVKYRTGGGLDNSFGQALDVNQTLTNYSRVGNADSTLKSTEAKNVVGTAAKNIKEKLLNPSISGEVDSSVAKEFQTTNDKMKAVYDIFKLLKIDMDDAALDPITKTIKLDDSAVNKLMDKIRQTGSDTSTGAKSRKTIDRAMELLEFADKPTADKLGPVIQEAAENFDLAQKAQGLGLLNKSTYLKAGPIQLGNRIGLGIKKISDATPEQLKQIAQSVMSQGGQGKALAMHLVDAIKKDNVGRNAALFSLQQNPEYRKMLQEHVEGDKK